MAGRRAPEAPWLHRPTVAAPGRNGREATGGGYWRSVRFLDPKHGFVVGGMAAPEWYAESKLAGTDAGGETWTDRTPAPFQDRFPEYIRIQFFTPKEGLIFGTQLLVTKDGGSPGLRSRPLGGCTGSVPRSSV
jgi:photosystem II stability/assembly factor-like uncharacterized protein